jgi:peptide/nickel transport system substrate-binding protein
MAMMQMLAEWALAAKAMAMPRFPARRAAVLALAALLAALPGGCRDSNAGQTKVVVIGRDPALRDPTAQSVSAGDEILLQSVAQGLVAFDSGGNIVGGLAERWNVSDDGMSYIFRITSAKWSDGRKVTAEPVARVLKRAMNPAGRNPLRDTLGAVEDVVAMTDRVIEIRLAAPRPNLLPLLAQPEFAVIRSGVGTGPFKIASKRNEGWRELTRSTQANDDEEAETETILLKGEQAKDAIAGFAAGDSELVLGGTFADLALTQRVKLPRGALRFDPASGLFGLVPLKTNGRFASEEVRNLLSRAIDRQAFVAALGVPGLVPRATVLEANLDGIAPPAQPAWMPVPISDRRTSVVRDAAGLLGDTAGLAPVRIWLPEGPGGDLLLQELAVDWGALGLKVERSPSLRAADFALIDEVSPSLSPAWFVRRFRCGVVPVCDSQADELLDGARVATVPAQRYALITQAAARIDDKTLFIPISAPVRWSLVGNDINGFRGNRFARHSLVGLRQSASGRD